MHIATHQGRIAAEPPRPGRVLAPSVVHFAVLILVAMLLSACSGNGPDEAPEADASSTSASFPERTDQPLPEFFPGQIPLADDHVIVRNESRIGEQSGRVIAMNIALPGTIDNWRGQYEEALEQNFKDIEFIEDHSSLQWRFRGQGFEYAVLYLNENRGHLDRDKIDSTHLPVMVTLTMTEFRNQGASE